MMSLVKVQYRRHTMYAVILFFTIFSQTTSGQIYNVSHLSNSSHQSTLVQVADRSSNITQVEQNRENKTVKMFQHKKMNISCPELDWTFFNDPPFDHLELPACGNVIKPRLTLYGPSKNCDLDPAYLPNNKTNQCITDIIHTDNIKEVVVTTHGFLKSFTSSTWMHDMAEYLLKNKDSIAVLVVGWGHGSGGLPVPDPLYYWKAASNTRYMAVMLKKILVEMVELGMTVTNRLDAGPSFHCIGHSLGAHICSFVGKSLANDSSAYFSLRRISALDPAGPLFADDVPYPFNMNIQNSARLDPSDADLVDVIHTDGKARFPWMIVPKYGTMMKLGHIDFYPGRDDQFGWNQPGCWEVMDIGACSHSRAHDLYLSSMSSPCPASKRCTDTTNIPESCQNMTTREPPVMGYWLNVTGNMLKEKPKKLQEDEDFSKTTYPSNMLKETSSNGQQDEDFSLITNTRNLLKETVNNLQQDEDFSQTNHTNITWIQENKVDSQTNESWTLRNKHIEKMFTSTEQTNVHLTDNLSRNKTLLTKKHQFGELRKNAIPQIKNISKVDTNSAHLSDVTTKISQNLQIQTILNRKTTKSTQNKSILPAKPKLKQKTKKTEETHLYLVVEDTNKAPFCKNC